MKVLFATSRMPLRIIFLNLFFRHTSAVSGSNMGYQWISWMPIDNHGCKKKCFPQETPRHVRLVTYGRTAGSLGIGTSRVLREVTVWWWFACMYLYFKHTVFTRNLTTTMWLRVMFLCTVCIFHCYIIIRYTRVSSYWLYIYVRDRMCIYYLVYVCAYFCMFDDANGYINLIDIYIHAFMRCP